MGAWGDSNIPIYISEDLAKPPASICQQRIDSKELTAAHRRSTGQLQVVTVVHADGHIALIAQDLARCVLPVQSQTDRIVNRSRRKNQMLQRVTFRE